MGRRNARGNAVAHGAGRQAAPLRHQARPAGRGEGALQPATATLDYQDIINNDNISVVFISTTPESNHYPIARDCLRAGKNVMLEKPIALELWEADELIMLAKRNNLKFTIGYSQRFNTKIAYAKKKIADGTLGKVVSVLVSRHLSRALGKKIAEPRAALAGGDGIRRTTSTSCSGCWSRPSRCGSIRRAPTATCSRSTARTTSCSPPSPWTTAWW